MDKISSSKVAEQKKTASKLTPEQSSVLIRLAHKIDAFSSKSQVLKIGEKYFRVKELG